MNLFKLNNTSETFTRLMNETDYAKQRERLQRQKQQEQKATFKKVNLKHYQSPFRGATTEETEQQLRNNKTLMFPNVSASSHYNQLTHTDMGFKTLTGEEKRVRDMRVPDLLLQNEKRQGVQEKQLRAKEKRLRYLRKSQKILDYTEEGLAKAKANAKANAEAETGSDVGAKQPETFMKDKQIILRDYLEDSKDIGAVLRASSMEPEPEPEPSVTDSVLSPETASVATGEDTSAAIEKEEEQVEQEEEPTEEGNEENEDESQVQSVSAAAAAMEEADLEPSVSPSLELSPSPRVVDPSQFDNLEKLIGQFPMFTDLRELEEPEPETPEPEYLPYNPVSEKQILKDTLSDAQELAAQTKVLIKPIDPSLTPKVPFDMSSVVKAPAADAKAKAKANSKSKSMFKSKSKSKEEVEPEKVEEPKEPTNPVATPENPEILVKIDKYGHLSKSVYDMVQYENDLHAIHLSEYKASQKKKLQEKLMRYLEKIKVVDQKNAKVLQDIDRYRLDGITRFEVIESRKVKTIMDSTSGFTKEKLKILKETELEKLKRINECKVFYQKKNLIQDEINSILVEKENVFRENTEYANQVNDMSNELDERLAQLDGIVKEKERLNAELDALREHREALEREIEDTKNQNLLYAHRLEGIKAGEDDRTKELQRINDSITQKLNDLSVVKQETINSRLRISKLTDKIHQELKENERKFNDKLAENKLHYESMITEKQQELDDKVHQLTDTHNATVNSLMQSYEDKLRSLEEVINQKNRRINEAEELANDSLYTVENDVETFYQ